ncbi:hypothetical protein EG328_006041 [Venturia inaequalis]|uniref:Uncharacterized protein n=1 Tax=Venturia inaequalis TaxID=5025 RepID=A0A8H3ZF64_VENIN|nr:hypothetical protein EG328_006041 [Venturia inaequalis]KAE9993998.1 hypothetical protein EG327_002039 [Venturia inaequalis]RDI81540.1 hypothetical protein Vi05172_g8384 [Venturia inaequalis]
MEITKSGTDTKNTPDQTSLAGLTRSHKTEVATQTMIRASEELLMIIRQMQELWLFGKLDTVGTSALEARTEEDTKKVLDLLQQMASKEEIN